MLEEYQMHQLRHKRIPRDNEFFDKHGTPVTYQIQHEDNPNDNCNVFYPIKYKRGNKEKILRLQNDGEDFTVSSMLDELPIISVQQASDCFRMGKFINQFRQICGPETQSSASVNTSNTEYSSINSLIPSEDDATARRAPAMTHPLQYRLWRWQYCLWHQYSSWPSSTLPSQTSSRLGARENRCSASQEMHNGFWCSSPGHQSVDPETWRRCEDSRSRCINHFRRTNEGPST